MTSTLMLVLETCTPRHQLLTTDTLMFLKRDVCTDILSLIAHGTQTAVHNALKLLLHYWPPSSEISHNVSPYGGKECVLYEFSKFRHTHRMAGS